MSNGLTRRGIALGPIAGIPIRVDASWFLVFALLTWTLASGYYRTEFKGWPHWQCWVMGALTAILFFVSLLLHELSQLLVARRFGTPVRSITLFIFGGVSQLGGGVTSAKSEFLLAVLGPVSSLMLAGVFRLLAPLTAGATPVNEVYYPREDQACIRDLGLIVTDGAQFFSEEKRHATSEIEWLADGVPAYHVINTCVHGRYRIEKEILSDPRRPVVLQRIRFQPLQGTLGDYRLYALLAPHLGNQGYGNTAWLDDGQGMPILCAERAGSALALLCSTYWLQRSVGFVGSSDGWQDLKRHAQITWKYVRAEKGNVAMIGEIDLAKSEGVFVIALGVGHSAADAARAAAASLHDGFDTAKRRYRQQWQAWQTPLTLPATGRRTRRDLCRISASVLRVHASKETLGGMISSLSIPWGFAKGDDDLGGYHLVWPRDLVESAGGLLAVGAFDEVRRVLLWLDHTQARDGHGHSLVLATACSH